MLLEDHTEETDLTNQSDGPVIDFLPTFYDDVKQHLIKFLYHVEFAHFLIMQFRNVVF